MNKKANHVMNEKVMKAVKAMMKSQPKYDSSLPETLPPNFFGMDTIIGKPFGDCEQADLQMLGEYAKASAAWYEMAACALGACLGEPVAAFSLGEIKTVLVNLLAAERKIDAARLANGVAA